MLSHYRVLDLSDERGMLCGQMLADLGAEVIQIEPPGGSRARRIGPFAGDEPDPEKSLTWWAYARNKQGLTLDITSAEGQARLRELVADADVLVESYAPGYLDGLGLGYAALAAINPRLVMVSITAYGQSGPKANWPASDLTVMASSGALLLTGDEDRPPVRVAVPQAFLHGSAEGAAGALIALAARERNGVGQHVDVSAQTAAMIATQSMILQHGWGENPLQRVAGGVKLGPIYLRFIYACKDGFVSITFLFGTAIGPFSRRLMQWMYEEGFVDEAMRDKDWINYTTLILSGQEPVSELFRALGCIEKFAAAHTKQELFEAAMTRGLLIVPVSTTEDVVTSPQLTGRGYFQEMPRPDTGETVQAPGPFARFSGTPIQYRRSAPKLGEQAAPAKRNGATAGQGGGTAGAALPFEGLKVLDFTWVMVGPMGVRYLADYGATVVHVESSTRVDTARTIQPYKNAQPGPESSGLYQNVNAGKLGITLNLSKPEAREIALKLAAWADVIVESYSPKAMRAWGLNYEALRAVNPNVIMMSTCLNGQTGPHAGLAGFGTMGSVLAGFGDLTGWPDRSPAAPFGAYTDYVAPKFIASALMAALEHRRRTGEGQYIDLSQAETSIHFLSPAILDYTVNGRVMHRAGNRSAEYAPHGVYKAAEQDEPPVVGGRWVAIVCETEEQWLALCRATGNEGWARDERFAMPAGRLANAEALDEAITGWTSGLTVDAIEQTLAAAGVPVHRVASSVDAFGDPQLTHREHFVPVEHPLLGTVPLESSRLRLSGTPARRPVAASTFGQCNEQVLRGLLGMSDEQIVELTVAGALE